MEPSVTCVAVDRFSINLAIGNSVGSINVFPISLGFSPNDLQGNESSSLPSNTTNFTIHAHSNDVLGLSFGIERDQVILASSGYDGKVILWRFKLCSWEPEIIYSSDVPITSVAFSSEFQHSKYLAFIDINRIIHIYDTIAKEIVFSYSDVLCKSAKGKHKISFIPYMKGETEDSSVLIASADGTFYIYDLHKNFQTQVSTPDFQTIDDIFQISAYSKDLFAILYHPRDINDMSFTKLRIIDINNSCQDVIQSRFDPTSKDTIEVLCINWMLGSRTLSFVYRVTHQTNGQKVSNDSNLNESFNEEETNDEVDTTSIKSVITIKGRRLIQDYDKKWKIPILKTDDKEFEELKAVIGFKAKEMHTLPKSIKDNLFRKKKLQNIN
ncbi:hypothetical protein GPJ56_006835 [Histomonas meleagridis]|uniref:uncharacterized protein n=1 Tax=Histomonas meleagridis TaxID=135588 RepID=UPI00355963B2|nr:hypothetical protein GPJ56_006835 [Histomonas meleagridis]KAH0800242.1 hypothetical protein GO595_007354 [Histomonas meleagridis]